MFTLFVIFVIIFIVYLIAQSKHIFLVEFGTYDLCLLNLVVYLLLTTKIKNLNINVKYDQIILKNFVLIAYST